MRRLFSSVVLTINQLIKSSQCNHKCYSRQSSVSQRVDWELARGSCTRAIRLLLAFVVNRWWQNYFGTGLVKTVERFWPYGRYTIPCSAARLPGLSVHESGWNVKAMQKLIVMSAAYQQESRITPALLERDPENRLLARGPRHRLSARRFEITHFGSAAC